MIDRNGARTLNPDDVRDALGDAIADMLHVLEAEGENAGSLAEEIATATGRGERHYHAEGGANHAADGFSPTIIVEGC